MCRELEVGDNAVGEEIEDIEDGGMTIWAWELCGE